MLYVLSKLTVVILYTTGLLTGLYNDICIYDSGVKQGGILSPMIHNIYVDDLMKELMHANVGFTMVGLYYGTIFYADDIVLLGASAEKMKRILKLCYDCCNMFGICINPSKSKWYYTDVHNPNRNVVFEINDTIVENSGTSIKYLGVEFIYIKIDEQ